MIGPITYGQWHGIQWTEWETSPHFAITKNQQIGLTLFGENRESWESFSAGNAKVMSYTLTSQPDTLVELTSSETHFNDMVVKWMEYGLSNIRPHDIVDTVNGPPDNCIWVIIGSRIKMQSSKRELTAKPLIRTRLQLRNTHTTNLSSSSSRKIRLARIQSC